LDACKQLVQKCNGNFVGAGVYINIEGLNKEKNIDYVEKA